MSAPQPARDSTGRIHTMHRPEDGIVVYRAESGWWNLMALPPIPAPNMLFQIERAWNEAGINPGHHAKMKREVRARMPILAAYLDLLSAPQNVIAQPTGYQIRPRQSGKQSETNGVLKQVLAVECSSCEAGIGVMCTVAGYPGMDRIHIDRFIAAGLGSPDTPSPKETT